MATRNKIEKKQHIQVFTRVRPLSSQELRSQVVVECINSKEVCVRDKTQTKTFTFDRVFGPDSKQIDVYKVVVSPLIAEVLQGYNCTVFAYGQTGTGKTFTMVGDKSECINGNWEDDPNCGVIPRTLSHLFDELKVRADEFTVRVSFLELYNEELCDLLAPNDNDDGKNLKLFEDSMKKGSVIVSGLEERTVHNKDDVYAILEAGNLRRQTAPTLMNAQSSRSHTIFTITVHIKVTTPEGEDLIKTGKMNLVDLAGSENIGRSGAVEMRAREAGSINQSLLTLGRVITSLVERTPHIPYRESKLTRILQDSLGGRTKTSIIATVSPALCNIEETLSTFDYAHRARNITNKPEINQKTSKRVLLKEYTEEIERLRRDLIATREKHGVYLASENYNAIMAERENLNKELVSKLQLLKVREDELAKQEEILKSLNMDLYATQNELAATCQKLQEANKLCTEKEDLLYELGKQTNALLKTADEAVNDAKSLHDRLDKSRRLLEHNYNSAEKFKNNFCWNLSNMKARTKDFFEKGINEVEYQINSDKQYNTYILNNQYAIKEKTSQIVNDTKSQIQSSVEILSEQLNSNQRFFSEQLSILETTISMENQKAHEIISNLKEFSDKMKTDWVNLFDTFTITKNTIEKQSADIELVTEKLGDLTKLVLALPAMYNRKLKDREEELKSYAEKCEFLEKKQSDMRKQIEDFGLSLYKMAQSHVELLQREGECEEALRNVRNDRECQEENLFQEIIETLQKNSTEIINHAEEAEKINDRTAETTLQLIKSTNNIILPLISDVSATTEEWASLLESKITKNNEKSEAKLVELQDLCKMQIQQVTEHSKNIEEKSLEAIAKINNLDTWVNENSSGFVTMAENALQNSLSRKQVISSQITDHSNDMLSKINDRMNEIETFLKENIKRDEKTGNTPQRKEFNYPKNIFCYANRIRETSLQNEMEKNASFYGYDNDELLDDDDDNKENISSI